MLRIGVSVEGKTERNFFDSVIRPYLAPRDTYTIPIGMGGNISIDRISQEIERISYNFDFVTTFYDFYGFKGKNPGETKESLEQRMAESLNEPIRRKFIPYIQMHEFEGLLFSSPECIAMHLGGSDIKEWAESVLQSFHNSPEAINDSQDTAPSKRLGQEASYRKITHGPVIAKEIGLDTLRQKCPGFNEWLSKIEGLQNETAF